MESTIIERISEIIKYHKVSVKKLAEMIGMPQTTVNGYVTGAREPKIDFAVSIISRFENISPDWLLTGKGTMLKTNSSSGDTISATVHGDTKGSVVGGGVLNNGNINGNGNHVGIVPADCEKALMKSQCEIDYLKKEIKSLKEQLKKVESDKDRAIADKDKAMDMLHKALSR